MITHEAWMDGLKFVDDKFDRVTDRYICFLNQHPITSHEYGKQLNIIQES